MKLRLGLLTHLSCSVLLVFFMAKAGAQVSDGSPTPVTEKSGVQILSDTQGVDFAPYLKDVVAQVRESWASRIPDEVRKPTLQKGVVSIRFTILRNGHIGSMTLVARTGSVALDKAAWYSITSPGTFPPLPEEFHGPHISLQMAFSYNEPGPPGTQAVVARPRSGDTQPSAK